MSLTTGFRTLDDWLPWLESLSPREIVLGLDRVQLVIERLELGRPRLVINVAGTNGKGSSVAMLEALLTRQGLSTACYTSPHVTRYNERFRIDGRPADDDTVIAALQKVESVRDDVPLTFFEFGTLAALVAFDDAGVDAWVLEVGMGGRLDAVNAVDPDGCLITNVSLDHCAWLGDDVESIAREKAGVMRTDRPAVFGTSSPPSAILEVAESTGADLRIAGRDFIVTRRDTGWDWQGRDTALAGLAMPSMGGEEQVANAAAVLALLEALDGDLLPGADIVSDALSGIAIPGRFQQVGDYWVLDVAHNPAAGEVLARSLAARATGRVHAVLGMLADKDVAGFVTPFADLVESWIATPISGSRGSDGAATARDIANVTGKPCLLADDLHQALSTAEERRSGDDIVLVTGSFFVVGPALDWIAGN
jgi:dihydrofolate synthase/folylpolyglutamate synthase